MNKKGSIQDLIWIGVVLLVVSVTLLISFKVISEINTKFQAEDNIDAYGKGASTKITNHFPGILDNSFLLITVVLALMAFVLAALVRVHPIFFVFYIIVLAIVIFMSGIFSNVYQKIAAEAEFTALANQLTFTSHIMTYLPFIIGVFGTILAIVMFKLYSADQGGF